MFPRELKWSSGVQGITFTFNELLIFWQHHVLAFPVLNVPAHGPTSNWLALVKFVKIYFISLKRLLWKYLTTLHVSISTCFSNQPSGRDLALFSYQILPLWRSCQYISVQRIVQLVENRFCYSHCQQKLHSLFVWCAESQLWQHLGFLYI